MKLYSDRAGCCGIKHIGYVGGSREPEYVDEKLRRVRDYTQCSRGVLLTMALTNQQLSHKPMKEVFLPGIIDMGWELVTRFRNPNSGNIVNVFHYTSALRTGKLNRKYKPANTGE